MKRNLVKEGFKWVGFLIVTHIAAMVMFGLFLSNGVAEASETNVAAMAKSIAVFDVVLCIVFVLVYSKIESSYIEYRKAIKDSLRKPGFSIIKHWINEHVKEDIIKLAVFAVFQIPFMIFYSILGLDLINPTFFDQFYIFEAGFYALTKSPILGVLLSTAVFAVIYLPIKLLFMAVTKNSVKKDMIDI